MPFTNAGAAAVLNEIADLLEILGSDTYRVRAYRNAALTLGGLRRSVQDMIQAGDPLDSISGFGRDLAEKLAEITATGTCQLLDELHEQVPAGLADLLRLPGMGPRRVQSLYRTLGVTSLEELQRAALAEKVRNVRGFSVAGERRLLEAVSARLGHERRFPIARATEVAEQLCAYLRHAPGVKHVVVAGSVRRRRETAGDIDLLVTADADSTVADRFVGTPGVERVLAHGPARSSVMLHEGIQVDLRVVGAESFGAAWMYFTGSKAHNIALRNRAMEMGLKLNEHGLFSGNKRIAGATEAAVYTALGLPWIEPELREDRGELQAAAEERLPRLVTLDDLRGDLHCHSTYSDGRDSLVSMAEAARIRGMEYLAVTDHSPRVAMLHGLNAERLARQSECIDEMNDHLHGLRLLKSVEVDILEDGSLDLPDSVLERQDLVVAGIHERFDLPRERQTERLLRAMDHRCFTILAHPTGRLLEQRAGCEVDMERVVRHARQRGCFLELNAQPLRLDIDDASCRMARDEGVLVSIGSDAHSAQQLENLSYGIGQARRGWLGADHVLNAQPLPELLRLIAATMGRRVPEEAVA